jgi:hypothetical protein
LEDRLAPASGQSFNLVVAVASHLGSNAYDSLAGIGVDSYGFINVAGSTTSAIQTSGRRDGFGGIPGNVVGPGGQDVFVAKLDSTGTNVLWLRFLGGSLSDTATAFVVGGNGRVFVAGYTNSTDYPETFYAYGGHSNGLVTALSQTDGSVFYSTSVGGVHNYFVNGLAVDAQGRAFLVGTTSSSFLWGSNTVFLDPSGLHPNRGSFVAILDAAGNLSQAALFDDGQGSATSIALDGNGHVYLTGSGPRESLQPRGGEVKSQPKALADSTLLATDGTCYGVNFFQNIIDKPILPMINAISCVDPGILVIDKVCISWPDSQQAARVSTFKPRAHFPSLGTKTPGFQVLTPSFGPSTKSRVRDTPMFASGSSCAVTVHAAGQGKCALSQVGRSDGFRQPGKHVALLTVTRLDHTEQAFKKANAPGGQGAKG